MYNCLALHFHIDHQLTNGLAHMLFSVFASICIKADVLDKRIYYQVRIKGVFHSSELWKQTYRW